MLAEEHVRALQEQADGKFVDSRRRQRAATAVIEALKARDTCPACGTDIALTRAYLDAQQQKEGKV